MTTLTILSIETRDGHRHIVIFTDEHRDAAMRLLARVNRGEVHGAGNEEAGKEIAK